MILPMLQQESLNITLPPLGFSLQCQLLPDGSKANTPHIHVYMLSLRTAAVMQVISTHTYLEMCIVCIVVPTTRCSCPLLSLTTSHWIFEYLKLLSLLFNS